MTETGTPVPSNSEKLHTKTARITKIFDGDTFARQEGTSEKVVRLAGIDTPESGTPFYKEARDRLCKELGAFLVGKEVQGELDVTFQDAGIQDATINSPERELAVVYGPGTRTKSVNEILVEAGLAVVETAFASRLNPALRAALSRAQNEAKRNKRGIWSVKGRPKLFDQVPMTGSLIDAAEDEGKKKYTSIPGCTRIGTIWLYVPPVQISCTEHNVQMEVPTIRTPGSPHIATSQKEQRIEMTLIFPDMWSINYQLRPIIAQFIRSPILPLRNQHIWTIFNPTETANKVIESPSKAVKQHHEKAIAEQRQNQSGEMNIQSEESRENPLTQNQQAKKLDPEILRPSAFRPVDQALFAKDMFVILRNIVISTIPSLPQSIQVHLTLNAFNHIPLIGNIDPRYVTENELADQERYLAELFALRNPEKIRKGLELPSGEKIVGTLNIGDSVFKRYYKSLLAECGTVNDGEINWDYSKATPKMRPALPEQMGNFAFDLISTELTPLQANRLDQKIAEIDEKIMEKIISVISPDLSEDGRTLAGDTTTQLGVSFAALLSNVKNFFWDQFGQELSNLQTSATTKNVLSVYSKDYLNSRVQGIIEGLVAKTVPQDSADMIAQIASARCRSFMQLFDDPNFVKLLNEQLIARRERGLGSLQQYSLRFGTNNTTVISGCSATFSPRVVPISVLEHPNPSFQYMGRSDWMASINLQTCDQGLINQMNFLLKKSQESRMAKERFTPRRVFLKLSAINANPSHPDANGFFAMLGINRFIMVDVSHQTIKNKPGWWDISLRIVQSDLNIDDYETLIWENMFQEEELRQVRANIVKKGLSDDNPIIKLLAKNLQLATTTALRYAYKEMKNPDDYLSVIYLSNNKADWDALMSFDAEWSEFAAETTPMDNVVVTGRFPILKKLTTASAGEMVLGLAVSDNHQIEGARILLNRAVDAAIIEAILHDRENPDTGERIMTGYLNDTTAVDKKKALRLAPDPTTIRSFLHTCYPDLQLPTHTDDKSLLSPDFFYKRVSRLDGSTVQEAQTRLGVIYQTVIARQKVANPKFDKDQKGTNEPEVAEGVDPSVVSQNLYMLLHYAFNQHVFSGDFLKKIEGKNEKEVAKMLDDAMKKGLYSPVLDEKAFAEALKEIEGMELATVSRNVFIAAQRSALVANIWHIAKTLESGVDLGNLKDPVTGGVLGTDYLNHAQLQLHESLMESYDYERNNLIDEVWNLATPSTVLRDWNFLQQSVSTKMVNQLSDSYAVGFARVYPACKLFFVEEDDQKWGTLDDYYAYSAVLGWRVVAAKSSASRVATIQLTNLTERLSDQRPSLTEAITHDQTSQEQTLKSFMLKEGMTIMLRAGYASDPQQLESVFFGKIVSVSLGETVTIMAQSFGAELTAKIFNGKEVSMGYNSSAKALGDIVGMAISTIKGLDHFGSKSWLELMNLKYGKTEPGTLAHARYSSQRYTFWDQFVTIINPLPNLRKNAVWDPRTENIYLPFEGALSKPMITTIDALKKTVIGVGTLGVVPIMNALTAKSTMTIAETPPSTLTKNLTFDWYINNASLWDLLNEMALYFEDYIVTVLPYNQFEPLGRQRETIYIGPKRGLYKYTDRFDRDETTEEILRQQQNRGLGFINPGTMYNTYDRTTELGGLLANSNYNAVLKDAKSFMAQERRAADVKVSNQNTITCSFDHDDYCTTSHLDAGTIMYANVNSKPSENIIVIATTNGLCSITYDFPSQDIVDGPWQTDLERINAYGKDTKINVHDLFLRVKAGDTFKQTYFTYDEWPEWWMEDPGRILHIVKNNERIPQFTPVNPQQLTAEHINIVRKGGVVAGIVVPTPEDKNFAEHAFYIKNPTDLVKDSQALPGYTNVVNYHFVDSAHDIIENRIMATSEEIHNKVTIRFPWEPSSDGSLEYTVVADDNILPGNIRHLVSEQPNIDPELLENFRNLIAKKLLAGYRGLLPTKYLVASQVLAREMRPMYRGYIKIWGRPSIKPHDVVYINDQVNQMFGPIEVDQVVHEFDANNGFVTTIVPHAIITVADPVQRYQDLAMNGIVVPWYNRNVSSFVAKGLVLGAMGWGLEKGFEKALPAAGDATAHAVVTVADKTVGATKYGQYVKQLFVDLTDAYKAILAKAKSKQSLEAAAKVIEKGVSKTGKAASAARGLVASNAGLVWGGAAAVVAFWAGNLIWNKGINKIMGRDIINVTGLYYRGKPLTAGLEGAFKDSYVTHFQDWVMNGFSWNIFSDKWKIQP